MGVCDQRSGGPTWHPLWFEVCSFSSIGCDRLSSVTKRVTRWARLSGVFLSFQIQQKFPAVLLVIKPAHARQRDGHDRASAAYRWHPPREGSAGHSLPRQAVLPPATKRTDHMLDHFAMSFLQNRRLECLATQRHSLHRFSPPSPVDLALVLARAMSQHESLARAGPQEEPS